MVIVANYYVPTEPTTESAGSSWHTPTLGTYFRDQPVQKKFWNFENRVPSKFYKLKSFIFMNKIVIRNFFKYSLEINLNSKEFTNPFRQREDKIFFFIFKMKKNRKICRIYNWQLVRVVSHRAKNCFWGKIFRVICYAH